MYRIEVASGEETVFRTIEELAVGIRNGLVTPRCRIYHNASQKWLPIGLHPHYKKAMELPAASAHPSAPTPVPSTPRIKPREAVPAFEPKPAPEPKPTAAPAPRVPTPTVSAVVAMQQEVLRDLPVVEIPEPLPWARRPAPADSVAPAPEPAPAPVMPIAQAVQAQPSATVTYRPLVEPGPEPEPVQPEPVQPEPVTAEPVTAEPVASEPVASEPAMQEPAPLAKAEPLEEMHARPTARRSRRGGGRPLLLVGVAAALVIGAHLALTAAPSSAEPEVPAEEPAARVAPPRPEKPVTPAEPPARVTSAPARVRMTPGPAFAGSVPASPGADTTTARKAPTASVAPAASEPAASAPSIAPAPVELELALPDLGTDSIAPTRTGDSMAMKKILRALNGAKR
jgi:hypothetical protein